VYLHKINIRFKGQSHCSGVWGQLRVNVPVKDACMHYVVSVVLEYFIWCTKPQRHLWQCVLFSYLFLSVATISSMDYQQWLCVYAVQVHVIVYNSSGEAVA